jgi:hypothetical protein
MTIGSLMLLIAGAAFGFWLVLDAVKNGTGPKNDPPWWFFVLVFVLGGLSLVGPPIILMSRSRRPWREGRFLWFTQGTAAWLLWPPVVYNRVDPDPGNMSVICYFYGTPLMAVYVTTSLLFAGAFRRSRRRRIRRSWQETFGLLLSMAWAIIGWYLIGSFYIADIFRR